MKQSCSYPVNVGRVVGRHFTRIFPSSTAFCFMVSPACREASGRIWNLKPHRI